MTTVTAWSFRANGWVNFTFPERHQVEFSPLHPVDLAGELPFAYANKAGARKFAVKPDATPPAKLASVSRQWAKFPQIFDNDGEGHHRTFFR